MVNAGKTYQYVCSVERCYWAKMEITKNHNYHDYDNNGNNFVILAPDPSVVVYCPSQTSSFLFPSPLLLDSLSPHLHYYGQNMS